MSSLVRYALCSSPRYLLTLLLVAAPAWAEDFINFETPQVHPIALAPSGTRLAVVNTADNRLELFTVVGGTLTGAGTVPVGYDPVSVRYRTVNEAWVVNQISDTVSVVDLERRVVTRTLHTLDEPADVVFAGTPQRAYVSCSQANAVQVFDPQNLDTPPTTLSIEGEDPRALAVSPDGNTVYAAIFESGNRSTILAGGTDLGDGILSTPNVVSDPEGPYAGQNPPPNAGDAFEPPLNPTLPQPPPVGLIVKQGSGDRWWDDNGGDWTEFVSGTWAARSKRPTGWTLIDHDVAVINTNTQEIQYVGGLMNIVMALAVNPATGRVAAVGTDAINEVRFEPVLNGIFARVKAGIFHPSALSATTRVDLNPHLDYRTSNIPPAERLLSLGDPRGIAFNAQGTLAYVVGMGSNNLVVFDSNGNRAGRAGPIAVGEGPTGLALDEAHGRIYVLNRFAATVSVVAIDTEQVVDTVGFFDPTPQVIRLGRRHLFDTHATSGTGHLSCATCHVDTRTDRLAWDLGDPSGETTAIVTATVSGTPRGEGEVVINHGADIPVLGLQLGMDTYFHPMKGPMLTQTLQDIIGLEPHHWRGDRQGLEDFNRAFTGLMAADRQLTAAEMQAFEDYLATVHVPPNPFRTLDNRLPTNLPLPGQFAVGRYADAGGLKAGDPLPNGNAQRALDTLYRPFARGIKVGNLACVTCHALPSGVGTDYLVTEIPDGALNGGALDGAPVFEPIPTGDLGEAHHMLVSRDGSTQKAIKSPQLRTLYDRIGFDLTQQRTLSGFGFLHDGSVDSLARFMCEPSFSPQNDQEVADLVALMMAFSGSDFGPRLDGFEPPGTASQDAHAAVGQQVTLTNSTRSGPDYQRARAFFSLADEGRVELVIKSVDKGNPRGWMYLGGGRATADEAGVVVDNAALLALATPTTPLTLTLVPKGTGRRIGIDRDRDGLLDFDEGRDLWPNRRGVQNPFDPANNDATGNNGRLGADGIADGENDFDGDGASNRQEFNAGTNPLDWHNRPYRSPDLELCKTIPRLCGLL